FDVSNHPDATFNSTVLSQEGENSYRVSGDLQIRGVVQTIEFPLELVSEDDKRLATGGFVIRRLDFGLGADSQPDEDTVDFEVTIKFSFEVK
ncbi:MAG: YceI family protein, partial [Pseudomonadota bacterium]